MDRTRFSISGGWSEDEIAKIREDAFELLSSVGLIVEDAEVVSELGRRKGVRTEGERVFYDEALAEKITEWVKADNLDYTLNVPGRDKPLIRPPFLCMRVWDVEHGCARAAESGDLARAARLLDSYDAEGVPPVHPQDVRPALRQVATAKISYENSRFIGSCMQATQMAEVELLCRLGEAAGRGGPHVMLQVAHSPLRLDANSLRLLLDLKRAKRTPEGIAVGGGAMPLAGGVAPLLAPGFAAQGLAEALAAYGTGRLVNEKVRGYCSVFPGTFDMRHSTLSMASPEALLYSAALRDMHKKIFGQTVGGDVACTGKVYDAQAAAQKMAMVLAAALQGGRTFVNAGMTPSDEVFHLAGAVIDVEIIEYVLRVQRGLAWETESTIDIVREGQRDGTFLMHPTTMRFREEVWEGEVFSNESFDRWVVDGKRDFYLKAAEVAEKRIAGNDYHPEPDERKELDRIYAVAERELI